MMKLPIIDSLPPRRRKQARWAIGLLLAYAIIGFLILPPIVKAVAVNVLSKQLHREVSIQSVRIDPFVLSTTIRGLLIKDKDGEPFVSWDEVYVNFQLVSFLGHPWVFKEISTTKPYIRVQVNKDYTLNFSDLIAEAETNALSSKEPSKPLALEIDHLHIAGAEASLTDMTTRTPFKRTIGPIDVTLDNFRTDPDSKNPYSFSGTTDAGEIFRWGGYFSLSPIRSGGELTLENMSLNKYAALYQDFVRFEIRDGVVNAHAEYQVELSASNRVASVTNTAFGLRSFKLGEPGNETNLIELPEFMVTGVSADAVARQVKVGTVRASGGRIFLTRNHDNAINVVEMAKPSESMTNAPGSILYLLQSVTNAVALFLNTTNGGTATVDDVEFTNCALTLEDFANERPARLDLDQINLTANHISNVPGTNLTASLSLRWNTNGTIKEDIQASFDPPTVDVDLALDKLDLHPLDPYLESKVNVLIIGSKLGMNGHIRLRTPEGRLPEVSFKGAAWLDDFDTVDGVLGEDLLKWSTVRVSGIDANLNPPSVAIKQIAINDVYARVIIETNKVINLMAALHMDNTNAAATNAPVIVATTAKPKPTIEQTLEATNNPFAGLPKITIGAIVITNAQIVYSDRSVKPNVNIGVEQAGGTISGISSEELRHADVNLHAMVDNVGPVDITGSINPFSEHTTNEIKITARDIELTPTSPYSAKFAGYRIAEGKLNLDLTYHLYGKNLKSENVVTLDQFTFGEKVNSPDATHLPVRLAVAILKDSDGKIVLDVPIDGSLDDPQMRIGKVVTRAIVNILVKVATSPFSLLGAIFGGHPDEISYQNFTPGSADLLPASKLKLDTLVKGLVARPGLQLEIEGSIDPDQDREGLKRADLEREMKARKWANLRKSERATNTVDQVVLTPDERHDYIERFYAQALANGTIDLAKLSANTNLATVVALLQSKPMMKDKGAAMLEEGQQAAPEVTPSGAPPAPGLPPVTDPMELALLTTFNITDSDLQELASDRAKAVRDYLVQVGKVAPGRLFITQSQPEGVRSEGSRVYLNFR